MTKTSIAKFTLLTASILALPTLSFAGKEVIAPKDKVVETPETPCITGDIGVNEVSQYISRGLIFENQGAITQPYADLYFRLYQGEGFINKVSVNLGVWDSFHSRHTDNGLVSGSPNHSSTRSWYESDFTAGVSVTFLKYFTITPSYYTFLSPADAFNTFQGLNVNLAFDDTDLLHAFALHPHFTTLFELENKAGNGKDTGVYYEVGIAPAIPLGDSKSPFATITLPVTFGFGSDNFYAHNRGFGYGSAGVQVAVPLPFVPKCLGVWSVNGGVNYYYLGDALHDFNTPQTGGDVRTSRTNEFVYSGGLSVAF